MDRLDKIYEALLENTEISKQLIELLKTNNTQTDKIFEQVNLSAEQMTKNFGLGILQNIIAAKILIK